VHRTLPAGPAPLRTAIAPSRADVVVWVACRCTWDGLADRGARAGLPGVLGPARSLQASHGSTAHNDPSDAQHMAVLLRGGRRPQTAVSPAARRATRARLRRRVPLTRPRAARLAPLQPPTRPANLPEMGQTVASQAHRGGGAERWPALALRDGEAP
jgi:hypothetical protein